MLSVEITCPVYPSEDPKKVLAAVQKVFPTATVAIEGDECHGKTSDLDYFRRQIRRQKILDATRSMMLRGKRDNVTRFFLNKQAAFVGKISFCEEKTILGSVRVVIESEDLQALIDSIAPETVDGEEVLK
jgi:predicted RNA binding protein with dsRBD fold (UPF0201 family)